MAKYVHIFRQSNLFDEFEQILLESLAFLKIFCQIWSLKFVETWQPWFVMGQEKNPKPKIGRHFCRMILNTATQTFLIPNLVNNFLGQKQERKIVVEKKYSSQDSKDPNSFSLFFANKKR